MKSRFASVFVMVAALVAGQQAPSAASLDPAVAPASSAAKPQAPDLTYQPKPDEAPLVATPAPKPAITQPDTKQPETEPPSQPATHSPAEPAGDASAKPAPVVIPKSTAPDLPMYVLGPNDVVGVTVFDEKNVPGTYAIGPDGRISMPLIGDFKADGLTLPQLQATIAGKLSAFMYDPVVNVQLLRNNSKKYTLIGGVLKTGPFPLLQETTILDALAASGGFKDFANPKKIILRRGTKEFHFNYKDVIQGKHMEENITLQDGDIIYVPE